jgi:hypothetical protein
VHNGIIKMPQFLRFPMAKGGTKTIAHLSIADGLGAFMIVNCRMKKIPQYGVTPVGLLTSK